MGPLSPSISSRLVDDEVAMSSRSSSHQNAFEIPLNRLEPRPDSAPHSPEDSFPQARLRRSAATGAGSYRDTGIWSDGPQSPASSSKTRLPPMFSGPPPPISSSIIGHLSSSSKQRGSQHGVASPASSTKDSPLFGQRLDPLPSQTSDSTWRGLLRRQRALEKQIQQLLDLQASALVAGGAGGLDASSAEHGDGYSEDGSVTPTGTVESAVAASSRMQKSLYVPPRSTPEGNVIPVRQPARSRLTGLRRARQGIRESLADLVGLKQEEEAYVNAALSERKRVCTRLNRLATRRSGIRNELTALESDEDEPLGKELRQLATEHDSLDDEIKRLEKQLVGMRNRRRWLKDKMDDVKSKREAGLSGYHGALKNVDAEVDALLRRPPVSPLDQSILGAGKDGAEAKSSGGPEFLRLLPERRTVEMAQTWWETEVGVLERRRARITEEQEALEQGGATWQEVVSLVTEYERGLRQLMKPSSKSPAPLVATDGEPGPALEDGMRRQLSKMDQVMSELSQRMSRAESKHWNLLICAIGAELEAFREAHGMLKSIVSDADELADDHLGGGHSGLANDLMKPSKGSSVNDGQRRQSEVHDESDNEVPPDLLVSRLDVEHERIEDQGAVALGRRDDGDVIPPGFFTDHDRGTNTDTTVAMI
ncbi:hypothetical protein CDD80_632 [Ophiocordyceps camponoti-rufipedis]|uniref:Autophagy-related protein 28 n=1 Tax=Ophiocordyceps camponoti-rufipedis TaxID=2004952 RepID=A0A2C5XY68_9HYPO|nr:hypothetical protein CDD80_632 [Ophiocordyceps camponoti-rufipedis]